MKHVVGCRPWADDGADEAGHCCHSRPAGEAEPLVLPLAMALVGPEGRVGDEAMVVMDGETMTTTLQGHSPIPRLRRFRFCGVFRLR